MTSQHWSPPDTRGDILAAALRPGAAQPVAVHVRPEVRARLGAWPPPPGSGLPEGIRLVVDDRLPRSPGYEVHRAAPAPAVPAPEPVGTAAVAPAPCAAWTPAGRRRPRTRQVRWLHGHRRPRSADPAALRGWRPSGP
ncbi:MULTISPECIES: hypothetical protein [unclassified Blastococcus]